MITVTQQSDGSWVVALTTRALEGEQDMVALEWTERIARVAPVEGGRWRVLLEVGHGGRVGPASVDMTHDTHRAAIMAVIGDVVASIRSSR